MEVRSKKLEVRNKKCPYPAFVLFSLYLKLRKQTKYPEIILRIYVEVKAYLFLISFYSDDEH